MGYLVSSIATIEESFKNKITISGKANEYYSSLNLTRITPESGGVYFCAAYCTTAQTSFLHDKNWISVFTISILTTSAVSLLNFKTWVALVWFIRVKTVHYLFASQDRCKILKKTYSTYTETQNQSRNKKLFELKIISSFILCRVN